MPERFIQPSEIALPPHYSIEVFVSGLTTPISMAFGDTGELYVGDAGLTDGNGKLLHVTKTGFQMIADGFIPPLTGITYYQNAFYISHKGKITRVDPDGIKTDLVIGLPSFGDHQNNRVEFGPDGKMYFGQGTATNSGIVGVDNATWVKEHPYFHDIPGETVTLTGKNFVTQNILSPNHYDYAYTGAYNPYNYPTYPLEIVKGNTISSGSILRANRDGSDIESIAWGLRNPFICKFDRQNRLFVSNHGMDVRGSRPIANSPDEFQMIQYNYWYGWPDYSGGQPITLPQFKPPQFSQPTFLLNAHPMKPPKPFATFTPHAAITGFTFNYDSHFGYMNQVFIAEFGSEAPETTGGPMIPNVGHKVSCIDLMTGSIYPFAENKSGVANSYNQNGGFERPVDVVFGKDGALYVLDFGLETQDEENGEQFIPQTGLIWVIKKI